MDKNQLNQNWQENVDYLRLSNRLRKIYELVPFGSRVCDVGTDHGFLPIALVSTGKAPEVLAMDLRTGPLDRAKEHVQDANLTEQITLRISDGLEKLEAGEADTITICGMGGNVMQHILEDTPKATVPSLGIKTLILQPQSELFEFRTYLMEHQFEILDEEMVLEDGKYYPMIVASFTETPVSYTELECSFGPVLLRKRHPILKSYLEKQLALQQKIQNQIMANSKNPDMDRILETKEEMKKIQEAMDLF